MACLSCRLTVQDEFDKKELAFELQDNKDLETFEPERSTTVGDPVSEERYIALEVLLFIVVSELNFKFDEC